MGNSFSYDNPYYLEEWKDLDIKLPIQHTTFHSGDFTLSNVVDASGSLALCCRYKTDVLDGIGSHMGFHYRNGGIIPRERLIPEKDIVIKLTNELTKIKNGIFDDDTENLTLKNYNDLVTIWNNIIIRPDEVVELEENDISIIKNKHNRLTFIDKSDMIYSCLRFSIEANDRIKPITVNMRYPRLLLATNLLVEYLNIKDDPPDRILIEI
jgi:hypothetical protein